jgi:glycosyltransferase involved in cell wall biosynthesis
MPVLQSQATRAFGFNVIGHVSGNLGLGVTARSIVQLLLDSDFQVAVLDVDPGLGRQNYDGRFKSITVRSEEELPFTINLFVLALPTIVEFIDKHLSLLKGPGHFNAAVPLWELSVIPPHWRRALEFFDALVALSEFIRHTLDTQLTRALSVLAHHPLYLPEEVKACRDRLGINADQLVFVTSFEAASDPARKNVAAIVDAFNIGLARIPEASLLIRLHNAQDVAANGRLIRELREKCERDTRIRIIDEPMTYAEVLSLYASSDVFVSLHRAEGLGLGPMEAMALGKATISTAWSGNMTYMNHTNACLVPYKLVPVTSRHRVYSSRALLELGAVWAEPDVEEAAAWMRRLVEEPQLRIKIGENAANDMARFQREAESCRFAFELQAMWNHHRFGGLKRDLNARVDAMRAAARQMEQVNARSTAVAKIRSAASTLIERHWSWRFRD